MEGAMRSDPFLDFRRTEEAAGYPAMLVVSVVALAVVVLPVMLPGTDARRVGARSCSAEHLLGAPEFVPYGTTSPRRMA
jgi:hypothetical protein